jgi:hypothetical protein
MSELNLQEPIFVVYVDVHNLRSEIAREKLKQAKDLLSYNNVTTWVIADKINKVELIWQGSKYSTNPGIMNFNNFENLINRFNEVIEVISNGTSDTSIKQQLRNLQLKKVLDNDTSI